MFKPINKLTKTHMRAYGVLRGFQLSGSDPQTPRQGSSASLDTPFFVLLKALWGGQHRRPSIFDRTIRVAMCEEEYAIDNRQLLEAIAMSYVIHEGQVPCFATRRGAFFGNGDEINSKHMKTESKMHTRCK